MNRFVGILSLLSLLPILALCCYIVGAAIFGWISPDEVAGRTIIGAMALSLGAPCLGFVCFAIEMIREG